MGRHRKKKHIVERLILGSASVMLVTAIILFLFFEFGGLIIG